MNMTAPKQSGVVYVLQRDSQGVWARTGKLVASDAHEYASFGTSVAIDGNRAIVGASSNYGFAGPGAAYIFERNEHGDWAKRTKLEAADHASLTSFEAAVAIEGETVVVGIPKWCHSFLEGDDCSGSAYVFTRSADGG